MIKKPNKNRGNNINFHFSKDLEARLKDLYRLIKEINGTINDPEFIQKIIDALLKNSEFLKKIGIKNIEIIQEENKFKFKFTLGNGDIIETDYIELPEGEKGDKGDSITFKGIVANLDELPKDPTLGDTYYINDLRLSVCWTGEEWLTLTKDGQGIKSIEAKDTQDGLIHTYELSWTNLDNEISPISEPLTIKDGEKGDQGAPATQEQVDLAIKNAPKKKLNNDDFIIDDNEIRINRENLNDDFWETTPTQDDNVIQPKNNRSVSMNNQAIINVKEPLNDNDVSTKIYTDNILKNKQDQIYFENDPEPIIPVLDPNTFQRNSEGRFISIQDFISDGLETEAKTGGGAINELVHKKTEKVDLTKFTNLDLGQVPWDEADPALQVFIRFRELNSQWIGEDKNQQIWPDDNFFEYDIKNDPPLTKETTEMTLYGTNNLYTGTIKVTFQFNDSLPISIGAGGHMRAIQRALNKKGNDTYWEPYGEEAPGVIKPKDDIVQLVIPPFLISKGFPSTPKGIFMADVNEDILLDNGVPNIGYLKEKYVSKEYFGIENLWERIPLDEENTLEPTRIRPKNNMTITAPYGWFYNGLTVSTIDEENSYSVPNLKYVDNGLNTKQNKLTPGTNITIDENDVISANGGSEESIWIKKPVSGTDYNSIELIDQEDVVSPKYLAVHNGKTLMDSASETSDIDITNIKYVKTNFTAKKDLNDFPNKEIGAVPWEETNPVLQVMNQFWLQNAYVDENNHNNWPLDMFFEMQTDQYPLTKESTTCTFYGTNNLYIGEITITFYFDDTLKPIIGYGGRNGYIQKLIDNNNEKIQVKQNITDNNLNTDAKNIVPAINEVNSNLSDLEIAFNQINFDTFATQDELSTAYLNSIAYTDSSIEILQTQVNELNENKQNNLVSGSTIKTIEGKTLLGSGNIDLTKADVGLNNVDNTSDLSKPLSNATQSALTLKANKVDLDSLQNQFNNLTIVQQFSFTYGQISVLLLGVATAIIRGKFSFKKGNNIYNVGSTNTALINTQNFKIEDLGTNWHVWISSAPANILATNLTANFTNGNKTLQNIEAISMSFPNTSTLTIIFRDNTTTPPIITFDLSGLS